MASQTLVPPAGTASTDTELRATSGVHTAIHLLAIGVLLAGITLWLNWSEMEEFWRFPFTQSFDGMSHLVIGDYYAKHIFPRTWGWAPHWFGGMPFPDFYPPLFYFVTAFLYRVLPFSYAAIAKGFLCGLSLMLPGLTASVTRSQKQSWWAAGSAGCLTATWLSYEHFHYGIALDATLRHGLFTQLPGYVCLLLWCQHLLNARESARARRWAKFFLFLLLLSSAHIVPVAMLFVAIACFSEIKQCIRGRAFAAAVNSVKFYATLVLLPLAAAAFWYVPLLWHSEYLATMTLPSMSIHEVAMVWIVPFGLTCTALVTSILRKDRKMQIMALACIFIALSSAADFTRISPSLPVQPFRLFASFCFLSCIPAGYLFGCLVGRISRLPLRCIALVVFIAPFARDLAADKTTACFHPPYAPNLRSDPRFEENLPRDSMINVEVPSSLDDARYLALNGFLSGAGYDTTYFALRESSITSIFLTPMRNGLSNTAEAWGIETFLGLDRDFLSQDLEAQLNRADYMGVGQFAASSSYLVGALEESRRVLLEDTFANWRLYKLADPSMRIQVLQKEPALFFGPVTFKKRSTWSYDYTRFQEEIFFQGKFDTLVARAQDMLLDTSPDLDRFRIAIITDYRYHDLERAYSRLKQYAKTNTLICITSTDPLFQRLASTAEESRHIFIFNRLHGDGEDVHPLRQQFQGMLSLISRQSRPIAMADRQGVYSIQIGRQLIKATLTNPTSRPVPVLIKSSYFPYWHRSDSPEPIYMVTPTYMLTYAQSGFTLQFSADDSIWVGFSVSLAAVLLAGVFVLARKLRSSGHGCRLCHAPRVWPPTRQP